MDDEYMVPAVPFPDTEQCVELDRLSLAKIRDNDPIETASLYSSCQSLGFFLLDMDDSQEGKDILKDVAALFKLSTQIFDLELEEKQKYAMLNGTVFGYKGYGVGKIDKKGTPDRCEFWGMSKDDIVGNVPPLPAPALVTQHRDLYHRFNLRCHQLAMMILDRLDEQLKLPIGTLASRHRIQERSGDQSRLLRMIPQPATDRRTSMVAHTDLGSITVLFNVLGGLQILPPGGGKEESDWRYVKPQRNCAIINVGDALSIFTNNRLRSNIHRVTYGPGEQASLTRYSLAYFARPENETILKRLESSEIPPLKEGSEEFNITAGEWVERRQMAQIQDSHKAKAKDGEPAWATVGIEDSEKIKRGL